MLRSDVMSERCIYEHLAKVLKQWRIKKIKTQKDMAAYLKIPYGTYASYECGYALPSPLHLGKLEYAFKADKDLHGIKRPLADFIIEDKEF